jgi:hypothetical protein
MSPEPFGVFLDGLEVITIIEAGRDVNGSCFGLVVLLLSFVGRGESS